MKKRDKVYNVVWRNLGFCFSKMDKVHDSVFRNGKKRRGNLHSVLYDVFRSKLFDPFDKKLDLPLSKGISILEKTIRD